jgi:hypothetical protein
MMWVLETDCGCWRRGVSVIIGAGRARLVPGLDAHGVRHIMHAVPTRYTGASPALGVLLRQLRISRSSASVKVVP